MPSVYAHHRLGQRCLDRFPGEVQELIRRNMDLYNLGLHGPDLMIFHDPIRKDAVTKLADHYHGQTGREFFGNAAKILRENTDEGAISYIFGILGHYTLDSNCHPFVRAVSKEKCPAHLELESDFDRHLLVLDGKVPAHTQIITGHLKLRGKKDFESVTKVYALTLQQAGKCLRKFRRIMNMVTAREGWWRNYLLSGKLSPTAAEMVMRTAPNPRCVDAIPELMARYERAEALYPEMMEEFLAHVRDGVPLGHRFDTKF